MKTVKGFEMQQAAHYLGNLFEGQVLEVLSNAKKHQSKYVGREGSE